MARRFGMARLDDMDENTIVVGSNSSIVAICLLLSLGFCIGFFQFIHANPQCIIGMSSSDAIAFGPPMMSEFTTKSAV